MPDSFRKRVILLDEQLPVGLRQLREHDVRTVDYMGWKGLSNGELIAAAEAARFDVFLTADRNLRYQQNVAGRAIAVVVLSTNRLGPIKASLDQIVGALAEAEHGSYSEVTCLT